MNTRWTTYTSSSNPGSARQTDGSGNRVTLNGDYTLKYTVTTSSGVKKEYKYDRPFTFDNTDPEITLGTSDDSISDTKRISITAKDISRIETLKYQLLTSDGTAVGDEVELSAGFSVVSNEVTLAPEKTGAYKIKVTATDVNGQSSEKESAVFYIRNAAPTITVNETINGDLNGTPITNSQEYTLMVTVAEVVANLTDFDRNQVLRYRTSADGVNYTDWTTVSKDDGSILYFDSENKISAYIELKSPVALNDGDNRIFIQAVFTSKDADTSKIKTEFIGTNNEMLVIYDAQPPQYKIALDKLKDKALLCPV